MRIRSITPSMASWRFRVSIGLAAALLVPAVAAMRAPAAGTQAAPQGDVARGEYLANNVAMCVQCHSPRDQHGNILVNEKFTGAPIPVRGPAWSAEWAYRTPAIAGLRGFTDDQIVMLLTEGHLGDRPAPSRPMPPFRMNRQDAEAIVAYLRTK
jgi:mono/diheme cytochrome c family protein